MGFTPLIAAFVVGLLGSGHCLAMCGGIVTGLAAARAPSGSTLAIAPTVLLYHVGRVSSYAVAGAIAGGSGAIAVALAPMLPMQRALAFIAACLLVGLGLYLCGFTRVLAPLERFGARLWVHLTPYLARFAPARTAPQALALGALWGWLPCGLVYSALATATAAGSPAQGAMTMAAFGLGTLPLLTTASGAVTRLLGPQGPRWVRIAAGVLLIGFGAAGVKALWIG
jgi:uncharacterized protein